ncbi:MAG: hypothetical protein KY429_00450 [Actinobacteria bacterium]|nr:hypothetical protein [Actinomycetota bacterium]
MATQLQHEAAVLLDGGLRGTLEGYGRVEPTGSFVLGLMAWRDLDIRVVRDEPDREAFFALGAKLLRLLHPHRMSYRDELLAHTPDLPRGLYWGVYLGDERAGAWKIDIWAIDEEEYKASQQDLDQLARNIDPDRRLAILHIKRALWQHPEYRKSIWSRNIYEAVLADGVRDLDGFITWLKEHDITV